MTNIKIDDLPDDTLDKVKTQAAGLKWLYEMELINSPQLINNLKLNIFTVDQTIKDVELLIDQNTKGLLIYIRLSLWGTFFRKDRIKMNIEDLINQLLPTYRKRVVTDKWIFDLALKKVQEFVGGKNEELNDNHSSNTNDTKDQSQQLELPGTSDPLSDKKEQTKHGSKKSSGNKQPNTPNEQQVQDPS